MTTINLVPVDANPGGYIGVPPEMVRRHLMRGYTYRDEREPVTVAAALTVSDPTTVIAMTLWPDADAFSGFTSSDASGTGISTDGTVITLTTPGTYLVEPSDYGTTDDELSRPFTSGPARVTETGYGWQLETAATVEIARCLYITETPEDWEVPEWSMTIRRVA